MKIPPWLAPPPNVLHWRLSFHLVLLRDVFKPWLCATLTTLVCSPQPCGGWSDPRESESCGRGGSRTAVDCLPCAWHCASISATILTESSEVGFSSFMLQGLSSERWSDLPKITQLVSGLWDLSPGVTDFKLLTFTRTIKMPSSPLEMIQQSSLCLQLGKLRHKELAS
jgi:hypothetical protein